MKGNQKLFAFKLAAKEDAKKEQSVGSTADKWKAREGVSIAGCTGPRSKATTWSGAYDGGMYC